ncbi:hypothetical protein D3C85_954010 [compost metagenome]
MSAYFISLTTELEYLNCRVLTYSFKTGSADEIASRYLAYNVLSASVNVCFEVTDNFLDFGNHVIGCNSPLHPGSSNLKSIKCSKNSFKLLAAG